MSGEATDVGLINEMLAVYADQAEKIELFRGQLMVALTGSASYRTTYIR